MYSACLLCSCMLLYIVYVYYLEVHINQTNFFHVFLIEINADSIQTSLNADSIYEYSTKFD